MVAGIGLAIARAFLAEGAAGVTLVATTVFSSHSSDMLDP